VPIPSIAAEIVIILALILANGFFAGAEIAIVAARRGRLQGMADAGDKSALAALELGGNPNRFLSTVQVGITVIGTFAAAFGGAHLAEALQARLEKMPEGWIGAHAEGVSLTIVVVAISFFSLILGELAPKRLALRNAEALARVVARPMMFVSQVARPIVWVLGVTTDAVLFLLGVPRGEEVAVSVEDIQHLLKMGREHGVLDAAEQQVAMEALRLGDRVIRDIMRPRTELDALDVDTPTEEVMGAAAMAGFSRLPVYEKDLDHVIGYIHIKDMLREMYLHGELNLRKMLHPPLFVPETLPLDRLLDLFQKKRTQLAIVLDEFGGTQGMVTLEDVFEELVGEIHDEQSRDQEQEIVRREDGSWLVDGSVSVDDLADVILYKPLESATSRRYSTVAGLVLHQLGSIPAVGAVTNFDELRLEVVDMDGQRIDRVLVSLPSASKPAK